jgi:hypothetical protein
MLAVVLKVRGEITEKRNVMWKCGDVKMWK